MTINCKRLLLPKPNTPVTAGSSSESSWFTALVILLLCIGSAAPAVAAEQIWPTLRRGLTLGGLEQPAVRERVAHYRRHKLHVERTTQRAQPFLHYIMQQAQRRGMPLEVALIPMVESAFDPYANSSERAAGLWQFMPVTADRFNIRRNWWYDGRRDLVVSTSAALDYLQLLARRFDGDWTLALAAYNAGGGRVNSLIRKNRRLGRPTDFWHLDLPRETRDYVPKILALAEVIRRSKHYGIRLHAIRNEPAFATVYAPAQLDLVAAAELADIPLAELFYLNAGYLRWATEPNAHHRLLLPIDRAAQFKKVLADGQSPAYGRWARHQVKRGETLSEIAQRYKSTVAILTAVNNTSALQLRPKQQLLVPAATKPLRQEPLIALEHIQKAKQARALLARTGHTVETGQSLSTIAALYQVQTRDLARWNGLKPHETLHAGRQLTIWKPAKPRAKSQLIRYTVRAGDSLYLISRRHNVKVADLRRWNNLHGQRYIKPGQQLRLFIRS